MPHDFDSTLDLLGTSGVITKVITSYIVSNIGYNWLSSLYPRNFILTSSFLGWGYKLVREVIT